MKTTKFLLINLLFWVCTNFLFAQPHDILNKYKVSETEFAKYKALNDAETRLPEFKDNDTVLVLKLAQLEYINKSRKKYKVQAVELDILASRVANKMTAESAENEYMGHWNMAGEKPYQRYAFAGGMDHVSENASARWTSGTFDDTGLDTQLEYMHDMHDAFMGERRPNDGHKQNCIEDVHNFVGIGYAITSSYFSYYEEFIDRYFTFTQAAPESLAKNEEWKLSFTLPPNQYLYAAFVYYEPLPKPMSAKQIDKKGSYGDYTDKQVLDLWPYDLEAYETNGGYAIPLSFNKEGSYYVHLYLTPKNPKKSTRFSTKGLLQASGVVLRVYK